MPALSRRTDAQTSRRQDIERRVLAETEALLAAGVPYAELSVERIATAAEISRTAFYFYFRDKRDLLMRLATGVMDALYEQADDWFSADDGGPDRLVRALRSITGVYREHGVLLRAVVDASAYDEEVAVFWRAVIGRFVAATEQRVRAEQSEGGAVGLDPASTAYALTWMTERTVHQHFVDPQMNDEALLLGLLGVWRSTLYPSER